MTPIPPELLALLPIALAAGVDSYLTILVIGAAPTLAFWDAPLPGALGDLDSPGVLIMVGTFYVLEFTAERFPPAALTWNAFHAIIRPVSGGLLAILLLEGQPLIVMAAGVLVGGALASLAHAARSGAAVLKWLGARSRPSLLLVSLAEDVLVLGIVTLALDAPDIAAAASLIALLVLLPASPSLVRAFRYAIQLGMDLIFRQLRRRRWHDPDQLPKWVGAAHARSDRRGSGGAARGTPAAAWRLPGAPRFAIGWVVGSGGSPVFVFRRRARAPLRVELEPLKPVKIHQQELFRRVDLQGHRGDAFILFGPSGPGTESLKAEFGLS